LKGGISVALHICARPGNAEKGFAPDKKICAAKVRDAQGTRAMTETAPTKTISDFEAKLSEADKNVASFDLEHESLLQKARGFLRTHPTAIPTIILISSILVFGFIATFLVPNNFLTASTLSLILKQVTVVGIIAIAQTLVILTAGIDLSVGIILVICAMIMGRLTTLNDVPYYLAIPIALAFGTAMGAINGILITKARIPPLIVTLGTYYAFRALNFWYTGSESVRPAALNEKAPELLIYGSFALIALAIIVWYMLNRTAWGRHVTAVGDDPDAAMLSGVQIDRTLISVYAFAGFICAFGAWVALGRVGSMSPIAFETVNLDSITAVVIGGTSLFGGRASIAGSVLGAMIVGVFFTGLALVGVESYWQWFAMGCLLIGAVAVDQWLRRASQ
jgi:fructose transport system permease protein